MLQLQFTPFPVLTTGRLVLRQLTIDDGNEIFALRSNDEVNRYLDRSKARSPEDARKFIQKVNAGISNNEALYWGICFKDAPHVIGTICLWNISRESNKAEIGYELLPVYQGKGIMQEALTSVIGYGFDVIKLHTIGAFTDAGNSRSSNLLAKLHFTRDTEQEKKLAGEEEYRNTTIYILVNSDIVF